jgi:hypothetical protein
MLGGSVREVSNSHRYDNCGSVLGVRLELQRDGCRSVFIGCIDRKIMLGWSSLPSA